MSLGELVLERSHTIIEVVFFDVSYPCVEVVKSGFDLIAVVELFFFEVFVYVLDFFSDVFSPDFGFVVVVVVEYDFDWCIIVRVPVECPESCSESDCFFVFVGVDDEGFFGSFDHLAFFFEDEFAVEVFGSLVFGENDPSVDSHNVFFPAEVFGDATLFELYAVDYRLGLWLHCVSISRSDS